MSATAPINRAPELGTASINRLLVQQKVPASIGILVMSLSMIVDTIFVGRWVGPLAIRAWATSNTRTIGGHRS